MTPVALGIRRSVQAIALVLLGGVILSLALFWVTSLTPTYRYIGPLCAIRTVQYPGFDAWTGEPHGRTYDCTEIFDGSGVTRITAEVPAELAGRRAVPLPLGFAIGAITTMLALVVASTRGNRRERNPQVRVG